MFQLLPWIYGAGVLFFFIRFTLQFYALSLVLIRNNKQKYKGYSIVESKDDVAPFSFFNWIVYNPDQFDENELRQIITHERVHVRQWHSLDVLFSQLTSIILWFNPFIWMYRKTLEQNLEFIADQGTQNNVDCKKKLSIFIT